MSKFEFKKEIEYKVKHVSEIRTIPSYNRIRISGQGDPNSEQFKSKIQSLFKIAYYIKMKMKHVPGYFEYTVGPLEGIYTTKDNKDFKGRKEALVWDLFLNQPSFVTKKFFEMAKLNVLESKTASEFTSEVNFEIFNEGKVVQMLHFGPFETEPQTVAIMKNYIAKDGFEIIPESHHEIYLSDFRRVSPEKYRTILRYKII